MDVTVSQDAALSAWLAVVAEHGWRGRILASLGGTRPGRRCVIAWALTQAV